MSATNTTPTTTTASVIEAPTTGTAAAAPRLAGFMLAAAITLSAFLLFQVQPLVGKYILPWFGGGAGIWTTCMLFFQVMLLVGYLYAHLSVTFLRPRGQAVVHALLVAAALAMLPIIPAEQWKPVDPAANPAYRILLLLAVTLGLPYVVLSATAPLLQAWFTRLFPGRTPYRLYALSNAASLVALLSFPFVFEPLLSRRTQAHAWSAAYAVLAALLAACIYFLWKGRSVSPIAESSPTAAQAEDAHAMLPVRTLWIHYPLWLLRPACASLMLLAITNRLSLDVAAVPFLWIVPLALYLVTFIICFDSPRWYRRWLFGLLLVLGLAVGCLALMYAPSWGTAGKVSSYCFALFTCCMVCHGELVALRPDPRRLTAFYLMVAAGGALGGVFVGLVAPIIFDRFFELHIGFVLTWLLFMVAMASNPASSLYRLRRAPLWYLHVVIGALVIAAVYGLVVVGDTRTPAVARYRNFYGVLEVKEYLDSKGNPSRWLIHNGILHGQQILDPGMHMQSTTYYRTTSGIGRVLASRPRPLRLGAVGLGTGTLAAAGRPGDVVRFYELDPGVERVAREHFTFIAHSPASVEVVLGDARLSLEREAPQGYDVLALDAFSGDGIPFHLVTLEVMETYLRHVKPDGVIAFHISNRHLDLAPVVAGLARHYGMHEEYVEDSEATWVLLARDPEALARMSLVSSPQLVPKRPRVWTDDHASLLPILIWRTYRK